MAEQQAGAAQEERWAVRMGKLVQRVPLLATLARGMMHAVQPRFTIGVVGVLPNAEGTAVFLVEHVYHQPHPWGLVGGWIGRNEDPAQCIEREFMEETALRVHAVRPLLVRVSQEWRRHLTVGFLCTLADEPGTVHLSHELMSWRWTPLDQLPPMVRFHQHAVQIGREALWR